jgi:hypothetical protein
MLRRDSSLIWLAVALAVGTITLDVLLMRWLNRPH